MTSWYDSFQQHKDRIIDAAVETLRRDIPAYASIDLADLHRRVEKAAVVYARDLDEPTPRHFAEYWRATSYQRAQEGLPLSAFVPALLVVTKAMRQAVREIIPDDLSLQIEMIKKSHEITAVGIAAVYLGYEQYKDEIISSQNTVLEEVSTPIVPVYGGVLVLPIVGTIDSRRAGIVMEALLEAINQNSADVVILDITGVPVIDTGVANYLLQAARAARLLGSTVVLVGIGAEIAQTIVQLGIDLTGIVTRANLQAGIEYALDLQGLAIRPKG